VDPIYIAILSYLANLSLQTDPVSPVPSRTTSSPPMLSSTHPVFS
jgi:hypothetical protein